MKANEAPEKIYLFENPIDGTSYYMWLSKKSSDEDIEYVRKDAFIKKAVEHIDGLIEFLNEYGHQLKKERIIEDFKKYMER